MLLSFKKYYSATLSSGLLLIGEGWGFALGTL